MNSFSGIQFLASVGFLLFGLKLTSEGLRQGLGERVRAWVERLTRNPLLGTVLGLAAALAFQSSTATVMMVVGLGSLGVLKLRNGASVILGADLGSSVLVLLLASLVSVHHLNDLAYVLLSVGFGYYLFVKRSRSKAYARALLGFAFVFYGLRQISAAAQPLSQSEFVESVMQVLANQPISAFLFALALTAMLQSSAAVLGILLSFVHFGLFSVTEAFPFVMGANLGNGIPPMLVAMRSDPEGRRLGIFHIAAKFFAVCVGFAASTWIIGAVETSIVKPSFQVAGIHMILNASMTIVLLPLLGFLVPTIEKLFPFKEEEAVAFRPKYLDESALSSPTLAFANVVREIIRMSEIVQEMLKHVLIPFLEEHREMMEQIDEWDDRVDALDRNIKFYLAKITQAQLSDEQAEQELELMTITSNLESVGDVINGTIMKLAQKKRQKQLLFSEDGWADIKHFHKLIIENFDLAISAFVSHDVELGRKVLRHKKNLASLEQELNQKHLLRLHQGLKESFDTSSIHLDLLSNLRLINSIVCKMAYPVIDRRG